MPNHTLSQLKTGFWLYNDLSGDVYQCTGVDINLVIRPQQQTYGRIKISGVEQRAGKVPIMNFGIINSGCLYSVTNLVYSKPNLNCHGGSGGMDVELEIIEEPNQDDLRMRSILAAINSYVAAPQQPVPAPAPVPPPTPSPQGNAPVQQVWVRGSNMPAPPVPGINSVFGFVPGDLNRYPSQTVFECVSVAPSDAQHYTVGYKYIVFERHGNNYLIADNGTEKRYIGGMDVIIVQCPMNAYPTAPTGKPANPFQQQPVQHAPTGKPKGFPIEPWDTEPTADTDEPDNWDRMATGQRPQKERKPYEPDKIDRVENF